MQLNDEQILSLSRELWEAQLGLSLRPGDADVSTDDPTWSSCIKVSGAWQGAIVFECPESVARHAAAMLFASDGDSTSKEDLEDALKELADMIGRRVRTLLPEETKLSRAALVDNDGENLAEMTGLSDLQLNCEGRPVRIALLHQATEPDLEPAPAA